MVSRDTMQRVVVWAAEEGERRMGWLVPFANSMANVETCPVRSGGPMAFIFSETFAALWNFFCGQHLICVHEARSRSSTQSKKGKEVWRFFGYW
jgi:hypothetical protein